MAKFLKFTSATTTPATIYVNVERIIGIVPFSRGTQLIFEFGGSNYVDVTDAFEDVFNRVRVAAAE